MAAADELLALLALLAMLITVLGAVIGGFIKKPAFKGIFLGGFTGFVIAMFLLGILFSYIFLF